VHDSTHSFKIQKNPRILIAIRSSVDHNIK